MLLMALSCAWVLGIFLGSVLAVPIPLLFTVLLPLTLLPVFKRHSKLIVLLAGCLFIFLSATLYYPLSLPEKNDISAFNGLGTVEIKGLISAEPQIKDKVLHVELSAQEINSGTGWEKTCGKVLLYLPRYPEYDFGDSLILKGKLEDAPQFSDFDYQAYLARQGVYATMSYPQIESSGKATGFSLSKSIYSLRENLSGSLSTALPEPHASLANGIVLGLRSTIPDYLAHILSITGTAHLLAISGMNLSIIAGLMVALGIRVLGRRHYFYIWLALSLIWFYAVITGLSAPVIRAAIMASVFLCAELFGRQKSATAALALSAAVMVGLDPAILRDVSFQLSFMAMLGLIYITPILQQLSDRAIYIFLGEEGIGIHILSTIADSLCVSLGAVIAVWPLIAYYFGIISFIGPLATLLITPLFAVIIISGAITALAGLISTPLAQVTGWVVWLFLSYMLWIINTLSALPAAFISTGSINAVIVQTYYSVLIIIVTIKSNYNRLESLFHRWATV